MGREHPRPPLVHLLLALVVLALLAVSPPAPAGAQDAAVPTAALAAGTVHPIEPSVRRIAVPDPRPLVEAVPTDDGAGMVVATDVLFAFDSAELSPRADRVLADLASDLSAALSEHARGVRTLTVVGHTDTIGTQVYNQALSERRAEVVAAALGKALGGQVRLVARGRGEDEPVADEQEGGASAAARNRRVEITLVP